MKNNVKDIDEDIDFSEEAFNKQFRRVSIAELPEPVRKRREAVRRKLKSRVTIYFDSRVINHFKELAEERNIGYQTLMNDTLLSLVQSIDDKSDRKAVKEDLLKDKKFLRKLKTALAS